MSEHGVIHEPTGLATKQPMSELAVLLETAINKPGLDINVLERLEAMYERDLARKAKTAFIEAMAKVHDELPPIPRRHPTQFDRVNRDGVKCGKRMYADIEDIATIIDPVARRNGFTYNWGDMVIADKFMTQACIISHIGGHQESSSATLPYLTSSGASPQQQGFAAATYLKRLSMIGAWGLKSCDEDTDGAELQSSDDVPECVSPDQLIQLQEFAEYAQVDVDKFCRFAKVASLDLLPASRFDWAIGEMKRKVKA